jgi:hypothetical protein
LGTIKEFAAEALHEDPLDTKLTDLLLPRWTNQAVFDINTYTKWRWNETFGEFTWPAANAAGASILYLPEHVDFPYSVYPDTTLSYNGTVEVISAQSFDRGRPDFTRDGQIKLVVYGYYDVELDNPGASTILITGAVGDSGMILLIEGLSVAGRAQRELVTVGGAGTVTSALTYAAGVEGVRRVTIVGRATGVTAPAWGVGDIVASSGGTTICTINSIYRNSVSCRRTELYGATGAFPTRYSRRHRPLDRDTDIIEVPEEFEEIVELGIMIRLSLFKEDPSQAGAYKGIRDSRLKELTAWDKRQPARTRVPSVLER